MLTLGSRLNCLNEFNLGASGMVSLGGGQMNALLSKNECLAFINVRIVL